MTKDYKIVTNNNDCKNHKYKKLTFIKATRHNKCLECHNFCNGCDGDIEPCEAFEYAK